MLHLSHYVCRLKNSEAYEFYPLYEDEKISEVPGIDEVYEECFGPFFTEETARSFMRQMTYERMQKMMPGIRPAPIGTAMNPEPHQYKEYPYRYVSPAVVLRVKQIERMLDELEREQEFARSNYEVREIGFKIDDLSRELKELESGRSQRAFVNPRPTPKQEEFAQNLMEKVCTQAVRRRMVELGMPESGMSPGEWVRSLSPGEASKVIGGLMSGLGMEAKDNPGSTGTEEIDRNLMEPMEMASSRYPVVSLYTAPMECRDGFSGECPPSSPVAVFVIGVSAAGKSSYAFMHFPSNEWNIIDPDIFLAGHPLYKPESPGAAHEATRHLTEEYFRKALTSKENFVLVTTSEKQYLIPRIEAAKNEGFCIDLIYVCTTLAEAMLRNRLRTRKVPQSLLYRKAMQAGDNFKAAKTYADMVTVVNNVQRREELLGKHVGSNPIRRYAKDEAGANKTAQDLTNAGWKVLGIRKIGDEYEVEYTVMSKEEKHIKENALASKHSPAYYQQKHYLEGLLHEYEGLAQEAEAEGNETEIRKLESDYDEVRTELEKLETSGSIFANPKLGIPEAMALIQSESIGHPSKFVARVIPDRLKPGNYKVRIGAYSSPGRPPVYFAEGVAESKSDAFGGLNKLFYGNASRGWDAYLKSSGALEYFIDRLKHRGVHIETTQAEYPLWLLEEWGL